MLHTLRGTYDESVNAAYIYFGERTAKGGRSLAPDGSGADFVLDIDPSGRLVGIEVLNASRWLDPGLLASFEQYGPPEDEVPGAGLINRGGPETL